MRRLEAQLHGRQNANRHTHQSKLPDRELFNAITRHPFELFSCSSFANTPRQADRRRKCLSLGDFSRPWNLLLEHKRPTLVKYLLSMVCQCDTSDNSGLLRCTAAQKFWDMEGTNPSPSEGRGIG